MKILTNIMFAQTAGIAQVLYSFMDFIENRLNSKVKVSAVNIINDKEKSYKLKRNKNTSTLSINIRVPDIINVINKAKTIEEVKLVFEPIIQCYQTAIQREKPNIILVNGTYYMPWCLLLASQRENVPTVIHYHGVLSRETRHWAKRPKRLFLEMEKCFDNKNLTYIFPSTLTRRVVEREVFGHKIKKGYIIPNPVPTHFFDTKCRISNKNIGIVSRWTKVKNVSFCEKLAKYNHKLGAKFLLNIITDLNEKNKNYKKLAKLVKFHKPTSNRSLASFYRNMGVVISPSHFETYGNVAKEAIATGTPAIVNRNMGVAETFNKLGLNTWITNFNSVKSVYKKIESIIGNNVDQKIRNKIMESYAAPKIFGRIISILRDVI